MLFLSFDPGPGQLISCQYLCVNLIQCVFFSFSNLINGINDQIEDVPLELFENVIGVKVVN